MRETISVYRKISCLVTNSGLLKTNGIRPTLDHLGLFRKAALVFSNTRGVLWRGYDAELPKKYSKARAYDCGGLVAYPGLVDSHTHPAFAGDRAHEFSLRMAGASYQDIAVAGGGILSTVNATRNASLDTLTKLVESRLKVAHGFGVRAMEAKSGYGLTEASELTSLNAISRAAKKFGKIKVLRTCLAAHAVPVEYKDSRGKWVDVICKNILPQVKKKRLADFVDVFCDRGYFTNDETLTIFNVAKKLGLQTRLHGDELANTGGAELAAHAGSLSVDHLLKISDSGIQALADSQTIATLLPGTSLFLREAPAPARKLIDAGIAVALATDFNPGTCPTQNLPFIASLAVIQLGMTPAEAIAAITWNGAQALGIQKKFGALEEGYMGEPIFSPGEDSASLLYRLAPAELPIPSRL